MGLFGAIGGILGGLGLFKGGSGVGRAAKSLAADTGRTMAALREDVREIKDHLLREAWPQVNRTLAEVQALVKETQTFVSTGTFTVKILALLLLVCVLYLLKKQITSIEWRRNTYWLSPARALGGSTGTLVLAVEEIFFKFVFWTCLLMAVVLVLHLVQQLFAIANVGNLWPKNVPFIIIIPSVAAFTVVLQHIGDFIHALASTLALLIYTLFGLPLSLSVSPALTGFQFARTSMLLLVAILTTIPFLYILVAVFPLLYLREVFQLKLSPLELALLVYIVFFATAIVVNILGEVVLRVLIKPLWGCWARKAHYD